jgi:hypothetical protein
MVLPTVRPRPAGAGYSEFHVAKALVNSKSIAAPDRMELIGVSDVIPIIETSFQRVQRMIGCSSQKQGVYIDWGVGTERLPRYDLMLAVSTSSAGAAVIWSRSCGMMRLGCRSTQAPWKVDLASASVCRWSGRCGPYLEEKELLPWNWIPSASTISARAA